jgi:hypothetical protein
MSLALAPTRGTSILPDQALEQEMARLSLARAHPNQIRTANPAKLEADSVAADFATFDGIGQET